MKNGAMAEMSGLTMSFSTSGSRAAYAGAKCSHFVPEFDDAADVGFDLRQMESDVSIELLEESDAIADHNREDRIPDLVGQPETKAFAGDDTAANEPDAAELGPQTVIHEL